MTEIFGTLGPACAQVNILEKMFLEGMTGMRLNLSHTGLKESEPLIGSFWKAAQRAGVNPQLLIDLQGPEIRIGALPAPLTLNESEEIIFSLKAQTLPQKTLSDLCRHEGKPFLVVTQLLASMEHSPYPTRAEVSDIFHAVMDGAAAVMVTNETAVGKYPAETIRYLKKTAQEAEKVKRKASHAALYSV